MVHAVGAFPVVGALSDYEAAVWQARFSSEIESPREPIEDAPPLDSAGAARELLEGLRETSAGERGPGTNRRSM